MSTVIIIGIGSDIGRELGVRFAAEDWTVWGTRRGQSIPAGLPSSVRSTSCDLASRDSIAAVLDTFRQERLAWDVLIVAAGTEEPIGKFWECDADAWDG